jgi:hypothetical protein
MKTIEGKLSIPLPPRFCGVGGESLVEEDLRKIHVLYKRIRRDETLYSVLPDWKFLNMTDDKRWPRHLLGRDRLIH